MQRRRTPLIRAWLWLLLLGFVLVLSLASWHARERKLRAARYTGACYADISHLDVSDPPETQRYVLRKLAELIVQYPKAARYTVEWGEPGSRVGGQWVKYTTFEPRLRLLRDGPTRPPLWFAPPRDLPDFQLSDVAAADIRSVAASGGNFADLQQRLKRR